MKTLRFLAMLIAGASEADRAVDEMVGWVRPTLG
jgi:hypothetical protein